MDPSCCVLVDDSWSNMKAAKAAVDDGAVRPHVRGGDDASGCTAADFVIGSVVELPEVMPQLFR